MGRSFVSAMLAALLATPAFAADCGSLASLRWLLGDWTADGNETSFHESWVEVGPQTFEGTGIERSKPDGAVKAGEVLRLVEMAGGVFYISKVTHNELPVAFRLNACSDGVFVFDNPVHDFPKRLEYRREPDDRLTLAVGDGADKGFALNFARSAAPADAKARVIAAEDARFAAMIAGDAGAMRRWFAADLWYVHSSGQVDDREGLIASIRKGVLRYGAVAPLKRQVIMADARTAIVQGTGLFTVGAGRAELNLELRYLAVYGLAGADWQLRAWQSLRLP